MKRNSNSLIPTPLTLAIILTMVVYLAALIFPSAGTDQQAPRWIALIQSFGTGFWDLLAFSMQMLLILVLGNVLALTPQFQRMTNSLTQRINNGVTAVWATALFSILLGFFNWGLGLILSALLARSLGEKARVTGMKLNYPLLVAAAYTGMMVWHGGLSGSAPLKVAEEHHFLSSLIGQISASATIFSGMNILTSVLLIVLIPLLFLLMAGTTKRISKREHLPVRSDVRTETGSLRLPGKVLGLLLTVYIIARFIQCGLNALDINFINLILFTLSLLLYSNLRSFTSAVEKAVGSAAGIIIQFPIYAGIMGMLSYSGLATLFTESLVNISSVHSLPLMAFFSAGVVNFFVPSGGGQWAVQGPILMDAALQMGSSVPKTIMALAYGDELTNMIQPFWAIPLLAITGIKAQELLRYTFFTMLAGGVLFALVLWFWP